jgi:polygalacturonase
MPGEFNSTVRLIAALSLPLSFFCVTVSQAKAQDSAPVQWTPTTLPAMSVPLPVIPDRSFNVRDYGAVGDGIQDDANAIQAAIKAASDAGGGAVVIPAGVFLSSPFNLASSIRLYLDEGATLKMIPFEKYPEPNNKAYRPFIRGHKLNDIEISGSGIIDGQGQTWWDKFRAGELEDHRPEMVSLSRITRLAVKGVKFQNGPTMHLDIMRCTDVTIDGVIVATPDETPNTDGIDISGNNIIIKNCDIADGDDNIATGGNTSNIYITNCKFGFGHGMSIGSFTEGGLRNMLVDNCRFDGTTSGLRGKSNRDRGGTVQDIIYSNITMNNVKNPIYFQSLYEQKVRDPNQVEPAPVTATTPYWKNITFINIIATTPDKAGAGIIWGLPEAPIENFTFKNVKISAYKYFKVFYAKNIVFDNDCQIKVPEGKPAFLIYDATVQTPPSSDPNYISDISPKR